MDRRKPILLIADTGVQSRHHDATIKAISSVLDVCGQKLPVHILRDAETQNLLPKEYRHTQGSCEWLLENAASGPNSGSRTKINADTALTLCELSVWNKVLNPYYLIVTSKRICAREYSGVVGWYRELLGAIISTDPFRELREPLQTECIETLAIHNLGHTFGLVPEQRTDAVIEQHGLHCTNYCSMRHYGDWIGITNDRKLAGPFCKQCTSDLQSLFDEK